MSGIVWQTASAGRAHSNRLAVVFFFSSNFIPNAVIAMLTVPVLLLLVLLYSLFCVFFILSFCLPTVCYCVPFSMSYGIMKWTNVCACFQHMAHLSLYQRHHPHNLRTIIIVIVIPGSNRTTQQQQQQRRRQQDHTTRDRITIEVIRPPLSTHMIRHTSKSTSHTVFQCVGRKKLKWKTFGIHSH